MEREFTNGPGWYGIKFWDGVSLSAGPAPPNVMAVTAYNGKIYIAGNGVHQLSGSAWTKVSDLVVNLGGLAAAGDTLFATSTNGIYRYNGSTWTTDLSVTGGNFGAIYASSPTAAYAFVGSLDNYRILKWNGSTWSVVEQTPVAVRGIGGFGSSDTWFAGFGGAILHIR